MGGHQTLLELLFARVLNERVVDLLVAHSFDVLFAEQMRRFELLDRVYKELILFRVHVRRRVMMKLRPINLFFIVSYFNPIFNLQIHRFIHSFIYSGCFSFVNINKTNKNTFF